MNVDAQPLFVPVILASGSGECFWPLSCRHRPEQVVTLGASGRSLLQAATDHLAALAGHAARIMVVKGRGHRAQVLEQLTDMPVDNLLVEHIPRDTAAAILFAVQKVAQLHLKAVMGVFPADHRLTKAAAFERVVRRAKHVALKTDQLAIVGINPTLPATGYGYLKRGDRLDAHEELAAYRVARFIEKPSSATARTFSSEGLVVGQAGDVTLVVRKDRTQDIEQVLQQLNSHPELERLA